MKKSLCVTGVMLALCLLLSSCGYRLRLVKTGDDDTTASANTDTTAAVGGHTIEFPSETQTAPEETTAEDIQYVRGEFVPVDLSPEQVLSLYRSAVNDVKTYCPGFRKAETQETSDVSAGSGRTQLANGILSLVAQSVLNGSGGNENIAVIKGDADGARNSFPLYGRNTGCTLLSTDAVESAECFYDGTEYKIVIRLKDALNPGQDSDFSKIMHPVDIDGIKNGISDYLVVLDYSQYQFDMNYTGCEITCLLDRVTSRMTSLTHRTVIDVAININLDLIVFRTDSVKCTGKITDTVQYTDFRW